MNSIVVGSRKFYDAPRDTHERNLEWALTTLYERCADGTDATGMLDGVPVRFECHEGDWIEVEA